MATVCSAGSAVGKGDPLLIVESMKMEITIGAPKAGRITEVRCVEGRPVNVGETLMIIEEL